MQQQIRVAAYGLLVKDEKILLCRLSPHVSKSAGMWTLPGGGIDFGESPEEAVVREVNEETGLVVTTGSLMGVDSLCDVVAERRYHSVRILYNAHYVEGELTFEEKGTTDACEWFSREQLTDLPMISLARKGVGLVFDK